MFNKYGKFLILALVFSTVLYQGAFAATHNVTTIGGFKTAITNAVDGDIINVQAAITLDEDIDLSAPAYNEAYTIIGDGGSIDPNGNTFNTGGSTNVKIDNLSVDGNTVYRNVVVSGDTTYQNNYTDSAFGEGALYKNNEATTINTDANFIDNTAPNDTGGAVHNTFESDFTITGEADFENNSALHGGAIYNTDSIFTIENGATFTNNTATNGRGGAIYNSDSISNFFDSTFTIFTINNGATFENNTASSDGGAIYNEASDGNSVFFTINNGATFAGNTAGRGGAIYNNVSDVSGGYLTFTINDGATFENNTANFDGGAIFNESSDFTINEFATFSGNEATNASGGAVYNVVSGVFTINDGALFQNNTAGIDTNGGAICNNAATINLIARTNNVEFTGNTTAGNDNAVKMFSNSVMNLNASDTANITFNDGIASAQHGNVININATNAVNSDIPADAPTSGEIIFNADMSGFDNSGGKTGNKINVYAGTLSLGADADFGETSELNLKDGGTLFIGHDYTDNFVFNAEPGSTLNLINNQINAVSFGTVNFNNMNLKIDVDLDNELADTISATTIDTNKSVRLSEIAVFNDTNKSGTVTVDPDDKFDLAIGDSTASGNVYNYNVSNNNNGTITLNRITGEKAINPAAKSSAVTQQSAFVNLANASNIAFGRADGVADVLSAIKLTTGADYRFHNKVAALKGTAEQTKLYGKLQESSVWFRPFNSIESIDLDNMVEDVDSVSYGALIGFDTPLYELKKGYNGLLSFYGGYSGANQSYSTVDLYQNGGLVGAMGAIYKGKFYTALSTNVGGFGVVENIYGSGSANYGLLSTSVASKTGYSFHLPGETVLQLSAEAAYTFVATQDYTNGQGTRIDTDSLNVLQLTPGVKITKNIKGWQPYISTNMVFNTLNESKVRANEVVLPENKLGEYVEYGIGIQKYDRDGINGFLQVMVRNGARTGVNFRFGLKHPVGKKPETI